MMPKTVASVPQAVRIRGIDEHGSRKRIHSSGRG
jgi:hypothetical protein